jgi:hypothetical protein
MNCFLKVRMVKKTKTDESLNYGIDVTEAKKLIVLPNNPQIPIKTLGNDPFLPKTHGPQPLPQIAGRHPHSHHL